MPSPSIKGYTEFEIPAGSCAYLPAGVLWHVVNVGVVPTNFVISGISSVVTAAQGQLHRQLDHIESMMTIEKVMTGAKAAAIGETYFAQTCTPIEAMCNRLHPHDACAFAKYVETELQKPNHKYLNAAYILHAGRPADVSSTRVDAYYTSLECAMLRFIKQFLIVVHVKFTGVDPCVCGAAVTTAAKAKAALASAKVS